MTLVQIQYFIEGIRPVKPNAGSASIKPWFRSLPGCFTFITKGKFKFVAIVTNVFAVPYSIDDASVSILPIRRIALTIFMNLYLICESYLRFCHLQPPQSVKVFYKRAWFFPETRLRFLHPANAVVLFLRMTTGALTTSLRHRIFYEKLLPRHFSPLDILCRLCP